MEQLITHVYNNLVIGCFSPTAESMNIWIHEWNEIKSKTENTKNNHFTVWIYLFKFFIKDDAAEHFYLIC